MSYRGIFRGNRIDTGNAVRLRTSVQLAIFCVLTVPVFTYWYGAKIKKSPAAPGLLASSQFSGRLRQCLDIGRTD